MSLADCLNKVLGPIVIHQLGDRASAAVLSLLDAQERAVGVCYQNYLHRTW